MVNVIRSVQYQQHVNDENFHEITFLVTDNLQHTILVKQQLFLIPP